MKSNLSDWNVSRNSTRFQITRHCVVLSYIWNRHIINYLSENFVLKSIYFHFFFCFQALLCRFSAVLLLLILWMDCIGGYHSRYALWILDITYITLKTVKVTKVTKNNYWSIFFNERNKMSHSTTQVLRFESLRWSTHDKRTTVNEYLPYFSSCPAPYVCASSKDCGRFAANAQTVHRLLLSDCGCAGVQVPVHLPVPPTLTHFINAHKINKNTLNVLST